MKPSTRDLITPEDLIAYRNEHNMSQAQLGELWNTPLATIACWEQGKRSIPGIVAYIVRMKDGG